MRKSRVPTRLKIQSIDIKHSRIRKNDHSRVDDHRRIDEHGRIDDVNGINKMLRRISNADNDAGSNNRVGSDDLNGTSVLAAYEQE